MEDDRSELVDFAVDYATKKGASYAEARYEGRTRWRSRTYVQSSTMQ